MTSAAKLRAAVHVLAGEFADLLREDLAARPDLAPALAADARGCLADAAALAARAARDATDLDPRACRRVARDFDALCARLDRILHTLHGGVHEPTAQWCRDQTD